MAFTSALKTEEKIMALIKIIDNGLEKSTLTAAEAKAVEPKKAAEVKAAEAKKAAEPTKEEVYEQVFDSYSRFLCEFLKIEKNLSVNDKDMKILFNTFKTNIIKYEKFDDVNKNIISDLVNKGIPEIEKIINYYIEHSQFGNGITDNDKGLIKVLKNTMYLILSKNKTIEKHLLADKIKNICAD